MTQWSAAETSCHHHRFNPAKDPVICCMSVQPRLCATHACSNVPGFWLSHSASRTTATPSHLPPLMPHRDRQRHAGAHLSKLHLAMDLRKRRFTEKRPAHTAAAATKILAVSSLSGTAAT